MEPNFQSRILRSRLVKKTIDQFFNTSEPTNFMKRISSIIMAAGSGKRMRSKIAKVLHPVAGRPMVWYMASMARRVSDGNVVVVVGHQGQQVKAFLDQEKRVLEPFTTAVQTKQLGTGHAAVSYTHLTLPTKA